MEKLVIIITGAAGGIGSRLVVDLLKLGHTVIATDLISKNLKKTFAKIQEDSSPKINKQLQLQKLDITSTDEWKSCLDTAVKTNGHVDVLINVAGYLQPGYVHETPAIEIEKHLNINAAGTIKGTVLTSAYMVRRGKGHIINIASLAGVAPVPGISLYSASKFAVRGFSLAAAQDLKPHGVHVSVICPDAVDTAMLDLQVDYEEAAVTFSGPRFLTPIDISRIIIEQVLPEKTLEVMIPWHRGILARFASAFPTFHSSLASILRKKGRKKQKALRQGNSDQD